MASRNSLPGYVLSLGLILSMVPFAHAALNCEPANLVNLAGSPASEGGDTIEAFYQISDLGAVVPFGIPAGKTLVVTHLHVEYLPSQKEGSFPKIIRLAACASSSAGYYGVAASAIGYYDHYIYPYYNGNGHSSDMDLLTPFTIRTRFKAQLLEPVSFVPVLNPGKVFVRIRGYYNAYP